MRAAPRLPSSPNTCTPRSFRPALSTSVRPVLPWTPSSSSCWTSNRARVRRSAAEVSAHKLANGHRAIGDHGIAALRPTLCNSNDLCAAGLIGREAELSRKRPRYGIRAAAAEGSSAACERGARHRQDAAGAGTRSLTPRSGERPYFPANCYERGAVPYMPISQIIRSALANDQSLELASGCSIAGLAALAPDLGHPGSMPFPRRIILPRPGERAGSPDGKRCVAFFLTLAPLASQAALAQPAAPAGPGAAALLLFIDDLQWADSGTLAVVRHLARRLREQPVLIVATYREDRVRRGPSSAGPTCRPARESNWRHGSNSID